MKILVTGIGGFTGSHLTDLLVEKGINVYGVEREEADVSRIGHLLERADLRKGDVCDRIFLEQVVREVKPDRIFHLAGLISGPGSWKEPEEFFRINFGGTLSLFEVVKKIGINPLILIPGSSGEYGVVEEERLPIKEDYPLRPINPYGLSKACQDLLGYQYFVGAGLNVIRTRAFNITGPGESESLVCSSFAKQIVEIEKGERDPSIKVGNLTPKRDFLDIRDLVKAYWLALEKGKPGEVYNICSGRAYSIQEILNMLLGMSKIEIKVIQEKERIRPVDIQTQIGNNTKFRKLTGWEAEIKIEQSLGDLLDCWRRRMEGK